MKISGALLTTLFLGIAAAQAADTVDRAVVTLEPRSGSSVKGTLQISVQPNGTLHLNGSVEGLSPGAHGFHFHELGDCSAPDASSAGGHFNPTGEKHSGPEQAARHVGDLGNIQADSNGVAKVNIRETTAKLSGSHSVLGRSVVVHEKADDLTSQPAGNSGARIACGVVKPVG